MRANKLNDQDEGKKAILEFIFLIIIDLQEVSQATYQRSTRETRLSISPRRHQQAFEQGIFKINHRRR